MKRSIGRIDWAVKEGAHGLSLYLESHEKLAPRAFARPFRMSYPGPDEKGNRAHRLSKKAEAFEKESDRRSWA